MKSIENNYVGFGFLLIFILLFIGLFLPEKESEPTKEEVPVSENSPTPDTEVEKSEPSGNKGAIQTAGTTERIPVELVRVIDGDTAVFIYEGEEVSVRYLLLDTPESKKRGVPVQPFSLEASSYNEKLLKEASQVYLEFDVGERMDRYNRLLAYVWADDILVNKAIVEEGLGIVAYVRPPNTRHLSDMEDAQNAAKSAKKNIWGKSGYVEGGSFVETQKEDSDSDSKNSTSTTPSQPASNANGSNQPTSEVVSGAPTSFKNCSEMRKYYPYGVKKGHPAYEEKHDRDKDDYACEPSGW